MAPYWTVQKNDLVGGFLVTSYPHPLSEHDLRPDGDTTKRGIIACECTGEGFANLIANLLNRADASRDDIGYT